MEIKEISNKKAYFFAFSIVLLIILSAYVGKIANFAALGMFLLSFFFLEKIDVYVALLAIFPFANIFKASPSSMSFLTICEIALFIFILLDFNEKNVKLKNSFVLSFFLFVLYLVIGFFADFSFSVFIKTVIRPVILYYLFNSKYSYEKKKSVTIGIASMLSISMILMMFLSLNVSFMAKIINFLRVVQIQNGLELLTRNGGLLGDPNYCTMAILMTLSILGVLYYSKQIGNIYWLFAVPLIIMGFTTYSKSYFLCIIAYAVLMVMFVLFPKHPGWGILITAVISIIVNAAMDGRIEVFEVILGRFQEGDITTGRTSINEIYLTYLSENTGRLFFGSGINAHAISGYNKVHNLYIESLYRLGIIGSAIYLFLIRSCLYDDGPRKNFIVYLPVFFMLAMYLALSGLDSVELIYYILICGISAKYTSEKKV